MAGHDGRAEVKPREEHVGVTLLVLERDEVNRRALGLREVDAAVPDRVERGAATLRGVRAVEVVAADDAVAAGEAGGMDWYVS